MRPKYIEHVTLTTGDSRRSFASEVSAQAIAVARSVIRHLPDDGSQSIPLPGPLAEYRIGGNIDRKCLHAYIHAANETEPIVAMAIAAHSLCGAKAWRELHRYCDEWRLPYQTDPERWPAEPWIAVAIDTNGPRHVEVLPMIADFELCLAWAWLAELEARRGRD